jgi:threonyl-tRNA synthetase
VVGVKEMESNTLAVRSRKLGDLGSFGVEDLFEELSRCSEIAEEMKLEGVKAEKVVEVKAVDVVTE